MRKMFYGMLAFLVGSTASMHAQITIGSDTPPTPGAVLDLQSDGNRGLLMPQVQLTSAFTWDPLLGSNAVNGMTVFNTSDAIANGLNGQ